MHPVVVLRLHAIDRPGPDVGRARAPVGLRQLDAPEPLEHALRLVDHGADGGRLGALGVQLVLHEGDELLAGLVGAVLVQDVVEVEEEGADVLDLVGALGFRRSSELAMSSCRVFRRERYYLFRGDAHDAHQLEEVEEQRLGEPLEDEGTVDVFALELVLRRD